MLSGVLQWDYRWKTLPMHHGPSQKPTAVVLDQIPQERDFDIFLMVSTVLLREQIFMKDSFWVLFRA